MRIVICANTAWNLINFRAGLIKRLIAEGHQVVALAPMDEYSGRVRSLGCEFIHIGMDKHGTSPLQDLSLCVNFLKKLRRIRPDVYLGYTVKPNIYGSIAAHMLGVAVINNIAGLGVAFSSQSLVSRVAAMLYKIALKRADTVFFQNWEDQQLFVERRLVASDRATLLPGSGVDLETFKPDAGERDSEDMPSFLLVARLLWEKGIGEFVEAARAVRNVAPHVTFKLLGFHDSKSPSAVPESSVASWVESGVIQYLGSADDVRPHIAAADCMVLPSYYREGTPRSLLEAAAMGKPIITSDSVGCRNVVDDGVNGFLCQPRDAGSLAEKMLAFIAMSAGERAAMGRASRAKAEKEFDENFVLEKYIAALNRVRRSR